MDQLHTFTRRAVTGAARTNDLDEHTSAGAYRLIRPLEPHALGSRWIAEPAWAADNDAAEPVVVYQLVGPMTRVPANAFASAVAPLRSLGHPHLLPIIDAWSEPGRGAFVVSPYAGVGDGLLSLDTLLRLKPDGRLAPVETRHMLAQVLSAMAYAHERGVSHGTVEQHELLIDHRGRIRFELYGLRRSVADAASASDADSLGMHQPSPADCAAEVRSVVERAFLAVTACRPSDGLRPASRRMNRPDRALSDWFERGLHPQAGFASAIEALRSLGAANVAGAAEVKRLDTSSDTAPTGLASKLENTPLGLLARLVS